MSTIYDIENVEAIVELSKEYPYISPYIIRDIVEKRNLSRFSFLAEGDEIEPKQLSRKEVNTLMKRILKGCPNKIIRYYSELPSLDEMTEWDLYDVVGKMGISVESCIKATEDFPSIPTKVSLLLIFLNYGFDVAKEAVELEKERRKIY